MNLLVCVFLLFLFLHLFLYLYCILLMRSRILCDRANFDTPCNGALNLFKSIQENFQRVSLWHQSPGNLDELSQLFLVDLDYCE